MSARSGRRTGSSGTREAILESARRCFSERGYEGTTMRAIAAQAGVDAALVSHFFGSKDGVFVAAMQLPLDPEVMIPALLAEGLDGLGERLVGLMVSLWDDPVTAGPLLALVRSAASHADAAQMLRGFIETEVLGRLAAAIPASRVAPDLRAALAGSQVVGLAMARYVVGVEPLASLPAGEVVALVGPTVQRYLTGT